MGIIKSIFAFFIELFRRKSKKQKALESRIEELDEKIKEIEDEDLSYDDITEYINDSK